MVQLLLSWAGIGFSILVGLYGTVARIYDIMLSLTGYYKEGGVPDNFIITTSNVMTTMYTLAGIFMLFRVTVSMINLLIDPDKTNDSQSSPSKLLTRIITSIAMLIIFVPTGWVFSKMPDNPGILMRLEQALLADNGLINNLIPEVNGEKEDLSESNKVDLLIDNVHAIPASDHGNKSSTFECYYVFITRSSADQASHNQDNGRTPSSDKSITGTAHLTFYNTPSADDSTKQVCNGSEVYCDKNSYLSDGTSPYTKLSGKITWPVTANDSWYSTSKYNCPNVITDYGDYYKASDGYPDGASSWQDVTTAYVGGWHSLDAMKKAVKESGLPAASLNGEKISDFLDVSLENNFLFGVSPAAVDFAQSALSSFIDCAGNDENCNALKSGMLLSRSGNDAVVAEFDNDNSTMQLDFIVGLVAGLGLVVWIAVLCVEVIIRRFKLLLLEMLSPIPIIAYSDPKDETFNKWLKMYVSIYLELFLKLIAITFAIELLKAVGSAVDDSGLLMFFYIVAILLFAKMIPDMISKIFGIDISSGTFKDIVGIGKKALGAGIGGAALATTGVINAAKKFSAYQGTGKNAELSKKMAADKRALNSNASPEAKEKIRKHLGQLRREYASNNAALLGGFATSALSGFVRGAVSGYSGKSLIQNVRADNQDAQAKITKIGQGASPAKMALEGIVKNFRIGKPTDKIELKLQEVKDLKEVTKNLQGFAEDFESALKKIPQLNDLAKLNSQGLITDADFKRILTDVGIQMNANRNPNDGTFNGSALLNIDGLNIKDINGRDIKLGDFTAGPYAKAVDTAEVKMKAFMDAINGNTELADVLKNIYHLDLGTSPSGVLNVNSIKTSTFDALRDLDAKEISIVNSAEYKQLKALEELYYKDK